MINPRQLSGASQALNSVASELNFSAPSPPKLPPEGEHIVSKLAEIEERCNKIAHEMRAMATVLVQRAQYAQAGQALTGSAPTLEIAVADFNASEIRDDMDKRKLDATERTIIESLIKRGLTHEQYLELLHGGHVLIEGRSLYKGWQNLEGVYDRSGSNSHYRKPDDWERDGPKWGRHYGVDTGRLGGVLFGPGPDGSTFIQLEGHGARVDFLDADIDVDVRPSSPIGGRPPLTVDGGVNVDVKGENAVELSKHMVDWGKYRLDSEHKNRGPHGTSVHNDIHPIVLGNVKVPKPTRQQLNDEFDLLLRKARQKYSAKHPDVHGQRGTPAGYNKGERELLDDGLLPMSREDYTDPKRR